MAQKPVLRGEVGCACVAREVSVERGGMARSTQPAMFSEGKGRQLEFNYRNELDLEQTEKPLSPRRQRHVASVFNLAVLRSSGPGSRVALSSALLRVPSAAFRTGLDKQQDNNTTT